MRLDARPADDRLAGRRGESAFDLVAQLVRSDDHELRPAGTPDALVDLAPHLPQVVGDELVDVPPEARLRPPALVVLPRLLLGPVDDLLEPPRSQLEDLPTLSVHERDEGAVAVACEI